MDVAPNSLLSLPVLLPVFGFSAITAPEYAGETYDINEGNNYLTQKVLKRANVPNMVLQRGATWYDSDFYRWTLAAITGNTGGFSIGIPFLQVGGPTYRRTLVLIQYFVNCTFGSGSGSLLAAAAASTAIGGAGVALSGGSVTGALSFAGGELAAGAVSNLLGIGPLQQNTRIPARAWVLSGVIPIRYKAGGDFDAASSALSIAELEVAVDQMDEISLAG
jgi:hypothetical protein